jgi:uncharacterized protein YoaH (UPF0181 family)
MRLILYTLLLFSHYFAFSQQTQIKIPVTNGNDDVEVSTSFYTNSSDLELGGFDSFNSGTQYVAIRFQNVALPPTAQISKAYIQFTTKTGQPQTANVTIKCQKGNAAAYLSTENLLLRTYVTPVVTWNPPAWTLADANGIDQQTANLSAQIQEAIATGWVSGNALSFILQGNATTDNILNAKSYETLTTHAGAPELVIEYTTGTNPCSPDVLPPTITSCPANISLTTLGTTAVATWTAPTVTDNCTTNITSSVTSAPTAGLTRGSAFPIGRTTITYNAKDAANNNAVSCVFTVTVSTTNPCSPDVLPPTIIGCPANINLTTTGTTAVATWAAPTVSDNCTTNITPSVTSAPTAGLTRGSAFPIGTTTVTYNAKDAANNSAVACIFTVTVSGSSATTLRVPIIDSNDDVEVSTAFNATSSDLELGGFDSFNSGAQYVALRFSNIPLPPNAQISKAFIQFTSKSAQPQTATVNIKCQQGNAAAYISTENILQRTYVTPIVTWNPPAWTVIGEKGVNQQTANLSAQVQAAIATGWASGNALSFVLQGNATTDNILNAISYDNNTAHTGVAELVIEYTTGANPCSPDVLPPTITGCPANISLTTTSTTAVATWTAPTVTDNCTTNITPSVTSAPTAGLTRGSAFPIGTTTVTYNAKDAANNNAVACVFTVTVSTTNPCSPDVLPPTITGCPANISLTTTSTTVVATWTAPTVADNCTTNITPSVTSAPTAGLTRGSAFPIGTTTVTYNAKDAANNSAVACIFTVTVSTTNPCSPDVLPPTITGCPANISLTTTGTTVVATWTAPTVTDNCATNITPSVTSAPTAGLTRGSAFPIGTTTVTYNAKDAANNNAVACVFTVTVTGSSATTLHIPIIDSNDDVEVSTVEFNTTSSDLELGGFDSFNGGAQYVALRFPNIALPTNAQISKAYIQFTTKDAHATTATVNIKCQTGNAAPYISTENLLSRTYVTPVVAWNPPAWTVIAESGVNQQTANLAAQIQAAIATGWASGNALSFVLQGNATADNILNARSYDNNATHAGAPELVIEYTIGTPTPMLFINEVAPQGTIATPSDWIELYNDATSTASLNDVYITNKVGTPFKFSLAGLTIPAKGFLVLLADNLPTLGSTHLNFKVSASGEKLYLFRNVNGAAVQLAFFESPVMSFLEDNVTVGGLTEGVAAPAPAALTKFIGGTPSAANAGGLRYIKATNSLPRGILSAPSVATLSAPAGTTIRYTTDNSTPSRTNGTIYTQPINISVTTVLKVFAYNANSETKVEAFTYIFPIKGPELTYPDRVTAAEYEAGMKHLPIISISSSDITFPITVDEREASFEYINKFGETGSASLTCGANAYGNSTLDDFKTNLRVKFKNEYGYGNFEYPVFTRDDVDTANNFTPTTKFDVLDLKIGQDGPTSDAYGMTITSQGLISKTMREMGNIDAHTRYVQAFVNGKYRGIYVLKEHWDEHFGETYYGGNNDLYDYIEGGSEDYNLGSVNLNSDGTPQGTITNWNALRTAAQNNNFQTVKNYLNVSQYIDMMLTIMYFDNEWEFRAIADPTLAGAKFVVENHDTDGALTKSIGDPTPFNYDQKWETSNPTYAMVFKGPGGVFGNLYDGGNKEFKTLVRDRVYEAFQRPNGALTAARLETKLNELKAVVRPAWNMEYALFDEGLYNNFDQEFAAIIPYLPTRFQYNLDKWTEKGLKHTLLPVTFNQPSGTVTTPVLAINPNPNGVIYYTLDGSDPMGNDGIINPAAKLYTNHLTLNAGVNNVVARVYFNTEFGPKTKATYTSAAAVPSVQIAQILSVNGRLDGQKAVVSWITKTTQEVDYFQVEKQNARGVFETLQTVNAQYSSNREGIELYNIVDEKLREGDNIYRVVLFSNTLRSPQYADPVNVKFIPAEIYAIYPNPTSEYFDIDLKTVEGQSVSVSIFNSIGTVIYNEEIEKASVSKRINIERLGTGQYSVVIQPKGKRVVMKKVSIVR